MISIKFWILAAVIDTSLPESLPSYEGAFLKMAVTFLAVLVGIIGTVWLMRRLSRGSFGSGGSFIHVVERKNLSPKTVLYLIETEGKRTLLAESQLEIKKIMDVDKKVGE